MSRLLVVEDEKKVANFIARALSAEGYTVDQLSNGDEALRAACQTPYEALILDVMLPGRDGISLLRELRRQGSRVPVLLLTARSSTQEKVEGLDAGANDYLAKPFALDELLARVRVMTRDRAATPDDLFEMTDLRLNARLRTANRAGQPIDLTDRDFKLLHHLLLHRDQPQSREILLHKVWDYNFDPGTNLVDVAIRRLRSKVDAGAGQKLIKTKAGIGYFMTDL